MTEPVPAVPTTRRDDVVDTLHGHDVPDPYRWLEDGASPEVVDWVARQNAVTRSLLDARPDRDRWAEQLTALMHRSVVLAAEIRGDVVVVYERPEGAAQARLIATSPDQGVLDHASLDQAPDDQASDDVVVIVDPAGERADDTVAIDWFHLSPDGSLVAYGVSDGGTENSVLHVARTADGSHLDVRIPNTRACSIGWEPDGSGFCYTRYPDGDEYHRTVHHHRLGDDWRHDRVIWADHPTPQTWPEVDVSPDGRYVLVTAMLDWSHEDVHLLDRQTGEWAAVVAGAAGRTSLTFARLPGFDRGVLVGSTTIDAANGRVVAVDLDDVASGPAAWVDLVLERDGCVVDGAVVAKQDLLVKVTRRATDAVERWTPDTGARSEWVVAPTQVDLGAVSIDSLSADPTSGRAVVVTSGFTMPGTLWRIDGATATTTTTATTTAARLRPAAQLDDPVDLVITEAEYPSPDGTEIGMFVIHRADLEPDDGTATILTGYGGFGIAMTPAWSPSIAAWCASGGAYAIAGLRGGGEHGEAWHRAGKREHKQNVFDDFCAAADWLVSSGRTSRDRLAIAGGSNGGLLVGAALTQRPDLCRAVWCAVPLLDMVRFPQFLIARLWTEEYGDPDVAEELEWLLGYSPYHRVADDTCYPAVLLTTAEGDTRVDPLHARKMAARLQAASSCVPERPVLLHQEVRAGHGQGKPVGKKVAEQADVLTFISWQLGGFPTDRDKVDLPSRD